MNLDPWNVNPEDPVGGFSAAPPKMTGIGTVMKSAGYSTAFAGKWDVGMATPAQTARLTSTCSLATHFLIKI